jgi:long-subunit fatty acid transport protein
MTRYSAALTASLLILSPAAAQAGPLDVWGFGGTSGAMGGTHAASPYDVGAIHANPAGLSQVPSGISIGMMAVMPNTEILLAPRPDGYDVPAVEGSTALPSAQTGRARGDTVDPASTYALMVGGSSQLFFKSLRLGASLYLPLQSALTLETHYPDERERYASNQLQFTLLGSRLERLDLQIGVSYSPLDWVSLGASVAMVPGAGLTTDVWVPNPADQSRADLNLNARPALDWGGSIGAHVKPREDLSVGLSWRSATGVEVRGDNRIVIPGADEAAIQSFSLIPSFTPAAVHAGLAWETSLMTLHLDARYVLWSGWLNNQGEEGGLRDTLSLRLGGLYPISEGNTAMAGVAFEPTPVPAQTGRTSYVDNSRILISGGSKHGFAWAETAWQLGWFAQLHLLMPRSTQKAVAEDAPPCAPGEAALCDEVSDDLRDPRTGQTYAEAQGLQTGSPGFPGYSSGGWIGLVGVELSWEATK